MVVSKSVIPKPGRCLAKSNIAGAARRGLGIRRACGGGKAIRRVAVAARWQLEDQKFDAEEDIRRTNRRSACRHRFGQRGDSQARSEIHSSELRRNTLRQRPMTFRAARRWRTTLVDSGFHSSKHMSRTATEKFRCSPMRYQVRNEL
jgi:hypothetical protein